VRHINPILPSYLRQLRTAGVKVALDTGYDKQNIYIIFSVAKYLH
jgi:hypothetical protein